MPLHRFDQRRHQRLQAFAADAIGCLPQNDDRPRFRHGVVLRGLKSLPLYCARV